MNRPRVLERGLKQKALPSTSTTRSRAFLKGQDGTRRSMREAWWFLSFEQRTVKPSWQRLQSGAPAADTHTHCSIDARVVNTVRAGRASRYGPQFAAWKWYAVPLAEAKPSAWGPACRTQRV